MTPYPDDTASIELDPDQPASDSVIGKDGDTEPGASKPLDDMPVPPLTEPADTNGG